MADRSRCNERSVIGSDGAKLYIAEVQNIDGSVSKITEAMYKVGTQQGRERFIEPPSALLFAPLAAPVQHGFQPCLHMEAHALKCWIPETAAAKMGGKIYHSRFHQ